MFANQPIGRQLECVK